MSSDDLDAAFVADLGLPDGSLVLPNAQFRKTWRVRNSGNCIWPEGTELVFISGDVLPGPPRAVVSQIGPGREVDISVELTAPNQPARYASYWRLQAPGGYLFGAVVYAEIVVSTDASPSPATSTATRRPTTAPTATPVAKQTPTSTPAPTMAPTAKPTPKPTPTPTPTPTTALSPDTDFGSVCGNLDPRFVPVIDQANTLGIELPCTIQPVSDRSGAIQAFWQEIDQSSPPIRFRSLVIVREDTKTIYVLRGKDTATYRAEARTHEDTWIPSMPEQAVACAPMVPPPGYAMPTQSIGKLWCEESLWNTIGWTLTPTESATLAIQGTWNKLLIEVQTGSAEPYLIAIDLDARAATVYQAP